MAIHLVQYNPEIPQNTGNIMRTCAATNTTLHLIKPMGFSLDEKHIKRSGANYVNETNYVIYENWEEFAQKNKHGKFCFLTRYGQKNHVQMDFSDKEEDYFIILGAESKGIPKELLRPHIENCFRIPMTDKVRSLNVSNVGAILVYEALRQQDFLDLWTVEPFKGADWILSDEE
ncbi:MAG: tRNA (cytidine(34)-2'-O)-methyltransferase [Turicibacter sp.]